MRLIVLLALSQLVGDGPILMSPALRGETCVRSIECAVSASDKSGNWWLLKADGSMLSSSSLTMSGTGSPGVSPITLNGTTQYYSSSASVAFPSTAQSFTVVWVGNMTDNAAAYAVAKWPGASQTFICGVASTKPVFYAFNHLAGTTAGFV